MTPEESFEIKKSKGYLVVKSNDLIQRNRFELSLPEQKTVAYICSMIQPMQTEESGFQLEYEFKIREYCKICGIDYDNGKNYQDVKATLKKLRDKSITKSELDEVKGIGKAKKQALLKEFGSVEKIKKATIEELMKVNGITQTIAEQLKKL